MPKKKTAAKKTTMTKAAFVRSMPDDMPADEVIAKGKVKGISLDREAVYKNRSNARTAARKSAARVKTFAKTTSGNGASKARGKAPDKKNRVLKLVAENPDWTAEQVAKAAKCSATYVYSVWRTKPAASTARAHTSNGSAAVTAFYRAVKGIGGVPKAKELLANIEAYENA